MLMIISIRPLCINIFTTLAIIIPITPIIKIEPNLVKSVFVVYPKIAIAVIIENGYWGSRWAAPIASLMTEKYLTDTITRPAIEQRMVDGALHEEYRLQHLSIYGEDSTYQANF